jgi:hypothetical protein
MNAFLSFQTLYEKSMKTLFLNGIATVGVHHLRLTEVKVRNGVFLKWGYPQFSS